MTLQIKEKNKKWISLGIVLILTLVSLQPLVTQVIGDDTPPSSHESDMSDGDPCKKDGTKPEAAEIENEDMGEEEIDYSLQQSPHIEPYRPEEDDQDRPSINNQPDKSIGDGLHLDPTTGAITTEIPLCPGFTIRYNSLDANVLTTLGYGWTHGNNIYLEEVDDGVVIVDGYGMRSKYLGNKQDGFIRPPQRKSDLYHENGFYTLKYFDGSMILFNAVPSWFDGNLYIWKYISSYGLETEFSYNDKGLLVTITVGNTPVITLTYEEDIYKIEFIYYHGIKHATFIYNEQEHTLSSVTGAGPYGHDSKYAYDNQHRIIFEKLRNMTANPFHPDLITYEGVNFTCSYIEENDISTERFLNDSEGNVMYHLVSLDGFPDQRPITCTPGIVTLTDGNGKTWKITRNSYGQQTKIESPDGYTQYFYYHESGNGERMLSKQKNPRGYTIQYFYDSMNNLRFIIDQKEDVVEYQYENPDFPGLMTKKIRDDVIWQYTYDENGCLESTTDPLGNSSTYEYTYWSETFRIKTITATDRNDHVSLWEYNKYGQLVNYTIDPEELQLKVHYEYEYIESNRRYNITKSIQRKPGEYTNQTSMLDVENRLLQKTIDPDDLHLTESYLYDGMNNIRLYTDPKGITTKLDADHRGRIIDITKDYTKDNGGLNIKTTFEYDGNSNLVNITDPLGNKTQFIYDSQNWLIKTIDAEGYITRYDRDPNGNIIGISRGLYPDSETPCYQVAYEYDELDRLNKTIIDPNGKALVTEIEYVDGVGNCGCGGTFKDLIDKIVDAKGNVTFFKYDTLERLTKIVQKIGDTEDIIDDDDSVIQYAYDAEGNILDIIGPEGEHIKYAYDAADRLWQIRDGPDNLNMIWTYEYDGANNLNTTILPNGNVIKATYDLANRLETVSDNLGAISERTYDANSNILTITDALGNTTEYTYDNLSRPKTITDPDLFEQKYEYDDNSNLIKYTDQNDIITKYIYNALGWPTNTIYNLNGDDDTADTHTSQIYNGLGLVEWLIDGKGNLTRYLYDSVGNLEEIRYADDLDGTGNDHISFTYDNVSNLRTKTDQNGNAIEFFYDDLHNLIEIHHPFLGDQSGWYADVYNYDKSGNLIEATNPFAHWTFGYDVLGRLLWHNQSITGMQDAYNTTFSYTIDERSEIQLEYPDDGRKVTYGFDIRLRPSDIISDEISGSWSFNLADQFEEIIFGPNAITSTFDYNNRGLLTDIKYIHEEETIYHDQYGYDGVGNRLFTRKISAPEKSELYIYDDLHRLETFQRGTLNQDGTAIEIPYSGVLPLLQKQIWDLDPNGNWLQTQTTLVDSDPIIETREVNQVNEYTLIDGSSFEDNYDLNGNLLDDGRNTYAYDDMNRLIRIVNQTTQKETKFTYGPLGNRVITTYDDDTTYQLYSGTDIIQERNADETLLREFIWDFSGPFSMIDYYEGVQESFYYLKDILGSTVALTDTDGNVVERYFYEPYGTTIISDGDGSNTRTSSAYGNPFMWTGQRYDSTNNLYHFWARTYSPVLGRWLQRDPLGYVDGLNLYQYVHSNPVRYIDPYGLANKDDGFGWPSFFKHTTKHDEDSGMTSEQALDRASEIIRYKTLAEGMGGVAGPPVGIAIFSAPIWGRAVVRFFFGKGGLLNNNYIRLGANKRGVWRFVIGTAESWGKKHGFAKIFGVRIPHIHLIDFWPLRAAITSPANIRNLLLAITLLLTGDEKEETETDDSEDGIQAAIGATRRSPPTPRRPPGSWGILAAPAPPGTPDPCK